jgi:hypothetical protein
VDVIKAQEEKIEGLNHTIEKLDQDKDKKKL